MPTELEELVGFLGAPQAHIRRIAVENLVGYSKVQPAIFKPAGLQPIKDLKVLAGDSPLNSQNAITILVNLSGDAVVVEELVNDAGFLENLLKRITDLEYAGADYVGMLLANMAKHDSFPGTILNLKRAVPGGAVSASENAMDQLMDLFVKGAERKLNKNATFDFLSYLFADVSRTSQGRQYFTTRQKYDDVIPISKLIVFTEHGSELRRRGVASTIKNACFEISSHPAFLSESEINLLPYILLPLAGPEELPEEDMLDLPTDLQFLPATKRRDPCHDIMVTHIESLLLLTTTRAGRQHLRDVKVYPLIRETHLNVEDEAVRAAADRLVQVLMRDEDEEEPDKPASHWAKVIEEDEDEDEDDDKVVEIA